MKLKWTIWRIILKRQTKGWIAEIEYSDGRTDSFAFSTNKSLQTFITKTLKV